MVLGESRVSLDQDVVKRKPLTVSPTFAEWVADGNAEQIIRGGTVSGTLYVVPDNFTLFIAGAWISAIETANATTHGTAHIRVTTTSASTVNSIIGVAIDHVTGQHGGGEANSLNFSMPIRVSSKGTVSITVTDITTPRIAAGFNGFLLPKKISIR